MYCKNCGYKLSDYARFCKQCGNLVGSIENINLNKQNEPTIIKVEPINVKPLTEEEKHKNKIFIIYLVLVFLLIIIGFFIATYLMQ